MARNGALVDLDGTLVDSNYQHTLAWGRALAEHGHHPPLAVIHRCIGMGGSQLLERVIGHDDDGVARDWRRHFDALLPTVRPLPGAEELLRSLHDQGLTVVLATSSPGDLVDALTAELDVEALVDVRVTDDDIEAAKPRPDVFQVALERAGLSSGEATAIGDSVWDVEAAGRAGVATVGVETGGFSAAELRSAGAVDVRSGPEELARELGQTALARRS